MWRRLLKRSHSENRGVLYRDSFPVPDLSFSQENANTNKPPGHKATRRHGLFLFEGLVDQITDDVGTDVHDAATIQKQRRRPIHTQPDAEIDIRAHLCSR